MEPGTSIKCWAAAAPNRRYNRRKSIDCENVNREHGVAGVFFEMAVTADDDAQSAVERELVLRLASLLWRLRRATAIESGLFE